MREPTFRWVQGPDAKWYPAQCGPEAFTVRIPGVNTMFSERDFTMGPEIITPTPMEPKG